MTDLSETDAEFAAILQQLLARHESSSRIAKGFSEASFRSHYLAATFRCRRHRCVLAYIYDTAAGVIVHQPGYKLSPIQNAARSSESGRKHNTTDGDRKWKPQVFFLQEWNQHQLNCDHVNGAVVSSQEILDAARQRRNRTW